jgi:hypothetical protein
MTSFKLKSLKELIRDGTKESKFHINIIKHLYEVSDSKVSLELTRDVIGSIVNKHSATLAAGNTIDGNVLIITGYYLKFLEGKYTSKTTKEVLQKIWAKLSLIIKENDVFANMYKELSGFEGFATTNLSKDDFLQRIKFAIQAMVRSVWLGASTLDAKSIIKFLESKKDPTKKDKKDKSKDTPKKPTGISKSSKTKKSTSDHIDTDQAIAFVKVNIAAFQKFRDSLVEK